jgi:glucosamine--fructose-6-phosphate aminotransferase (isomerizing)
MNSAYVADLLDQPHALRATLEQLHDWSQVQPLAARVANGALRQVVLTGMGASFHALHPLRLRLTARGVSAQLWETSELIHSAPALIEPRSLIIAVSQSGRSAEITALLERNQGRAPVLGVTNTANSPLAHSADSVVYTHAGTESAVSCKTYTASLAALAALAEALTGQDPEPLLRALDAGVEIVSEYLGRWNAHVEALTAHFQGAASMVLAGRGVSLAAAGTGALILKEAAHLHAEGVGSAAFRHGMFELIAPDLLVCVLQGLPPTAHLNQRLAEEVRARGSRVLLIGPDADIPACRFPACAEALWPVLEILPIQMMTLAAAQVRGHTAGEFVHNTKVTETE